MKIVIAPSGSGKTHLLKSLTSFKEIPAEKQDANGWSVPVTRQGAATRLWDGDTIPAILGVYKAMNRFKTTGPWWDNPEHEPAKAVLMRRAFGQIGIDTRYRSGIVLTAEVAPLFMMPSDCVVVAPSVSTLVANTNKRTTGQPVFDQEKAKRVHFWYKAVGAMAGVVVFSTLEDALAALHVGMHPIHPSRTEESEVAK